MLFSSSFSPYSERGLSKARKLRPPCCLGSENRSREARVLALEHAQASLGSPSTASFLQPPQDNVEAETDILQETLSAHLALLPPGTENVDGSHPRGRALKGETYRPVFYPRIASILHIPE